LVPAAARADINGFGSFANFTINNADGGSAPTVSVPSGSITLINGAAERRSIICNSPQTVSQFTASFTFQGEGGGPDGTCFVIENSPSGTGAVGFTDGYSGVTNSVAVALELDSNGNANNTGLYVDGNAGNGDGGTSTNPVSPLSNDPINVLLSYNGSLLNETLVDATTQASFSTTYVVNVPSDVGGTSALVGFTSSSNFGSTQTISNFEFNPTSVPEPATAGVALAGLIGCLGRRRRR
jgi:hypothetical protein